jgi:hypothetical protein
MSRSLVSHLVVAGAVALAASSCAESADAPSSGAGSAGAAHGANAAGTAGRGELGGGGAGGALFMPDAGLVAITCGADPDVDGDGDGFTPNQGDCNDCDPRVNPGAIDLLATADGPAVAVDLSCDGVVDAYPTCDDALALDDPDPLSAARALDLCAMADPDSPTSWGLLSARYVGANGVDAREPGLQAGLFDAFGPSVHPQRGARMLALSTGHARLPEQPGACGQKSCTTTSYVDPPAGFPQVVNGCDGGTIINDDIALELVVRPPANARGYSFAFRFFSFEFPEWICTPYNDQFIALASPAPLGSIEGNLSFDAQKNPVSVNLGFFDVCDPMTLGGFASVCGGPLQPGCPMPANPYCPLGPSALAGTGFAEWGESGATRWLRTRAPLDPGGELTLRFAIWDTGDQALDSTVLVDGFSWITSGSVEVSTIPIDDPL